ncbi:FAD-dependent oxidoreductase [Psychrobacter sp. FDAARGOS_221]|uniref:FAD-dependent oxidoreductase n=1 Tax=Psychrobacter sp. FDAARGOS_221 TaxID=1975705 RepID=UPI000BB550E1|nr:FAD-dependent oxidoreductase [Psychrobacter sp. FDAARGOS_221]PNK61098.1 pyridine nucleotide-disulfide oxidoreductase [Psychrobacter sp. FDAARGOS_221]
MTMTPYECQACGWTYPPQSDSQPDSQANSQIETQIVPFEDLPSDFSCPLCGVDKTGFAPVESSQVHHNSNQQTRTDDVVIIGAGLAGWAVADALRAKDETVGITLITADSGDRYHKPMLSAAFSQNKTASDLIRATGEEASEKANISLLSQTKVQAIDGENKIVKTDKGEVAYGNLVLAMGATPAIPPCFKQLPEQDIWHINDIDSFHNIQQALSKSDAQENAKHIAVIGAGMVGTEIAEDLTKAGHKVTLLDMNDAPLAMMLPSLATDKIKDALDSQGIKFLGRSRVDAVEQNSEGGYTLTVAHCDNTDKQEISVDHVLISTGLKVDPTLPTTAGINTDAALGIAVDESSLQTQVAHIYAIGDCMSIGEMACRYVAPLRAQAASIADHILGQNNPDYEHQAYQHKPPMIRLKNKSISVSATGTPRADESHGKWRVKDESETETLRTLELEQVSEAGEVVATATLKMPV